MVFADLHTHSTASDGQYCPSELVALAQKAGAQVMALTDHDTLDGLGEAIEAGKQSGVRVLRGIELGASEHRNLHILGYGFTDSATSLRRLCKKLQESRDQRKYRIIDFLKDKGICISLDEVEEVAGGKVIARPHFAQVMVRHGYVASNREAFDRYLDTDEYQKIERFKADARTCIDTIHADGGKVSWAHPYQVGLNFQDTEKLARQLADWGIDAMECYYNRHTQEQTDFYCAVADRLSLHRTGGSDFHGERVKPDICLTPRLLELGWLLDDCME